MKIVILTLFAIFGGMMANAQSRLDISSMLNELRGKVNPLKASYNEVDSYFSGIERSSFSSDAMTITQKANSLTKCGLLMYFTDGKLSAKIARFAFPDDFDNEMSEELVKRIVVAIMSEEKQPFVPQTKYGVTYLKLQTSEKLYVISHNSKNVIVLQGVTEYVGADNRFAAISDFIPLAMDEYVAYKSDANHKLPGKWINSKGDYIVFLDDGKIEENVFSKMGYKVHSWHLNVDSIEFEVEKEDEINYISFPFSFQNDAKKLIIQIMDDYTWVFTKG